MMASFDPVSSNELEESLMSNGEECSDIKFESFSVDLS